MTETDFRNAAETAYEPISLGPQCETKFQLCRVRYERESAPGTAPFSSLEMLRGAHEKRFTTHIFDAQTTPFWGMIDYLQNDFAGGFDRQDFAAIDGVPFNRKLQTQHPHEFPPAGEVVVESDIESNYPTAKSRFDHLAAKFRRHLEQPGSFLYVLRESRPPEEVALLSTLLSARSPLHAVSLLIVDFDDQLHDLGGMPNVYTGGLSRRVTKPPHRTWEGDDESWDQVLAQFRFAPTPQSATAAAAG
jgi:hypothetical protein